MKIHLYKEDDLWYWCIVAKNNKVVACSENYTSKSKCLKTAEKVAWSKPLDIVIEEL